MPFSNTERASIRRFMGRSPLGRGFDSDLEGKIAAVEQMSDGGATEGVVRTALTTLAAREARIEELLTMAEVGNTPEANLDAARAIEVVKMDCRRLVGIISDAIDYRPIRDVFSPTRYVQ